MSASMEKHLRTLAVMTGAKRDALSRDEIMALLVVSRRVKAAMGVVRRRATALSLEEIRRCHGGTCKAAFFELSEALCGPVVGE